jgi:hypothetical protein
MFTMGPLGYELVDVVTESPILIRTDKPKPEGRVTDRRNDLPLRPVPREDWQQDFDRLMRDEYLRRKYERTARVAEHLAYIRYHCPELTKSGEGLVVDVGPGPGEFLEWCRKFGWKTLGVEAMSGAGGMGDGYLQLSRLMLERQGIDVRYCGWRQFVTHLQADSCELEVAFFGFRGSWAQCYAEFVGGPPHHTHHDVKRQFWQFDYHLRSAWLDAFEAMEKRLVCGGSVLIAANRLGEQSGQDQYCREIRRVAERAGLTLVKREDNWVHQWRKA